jgi:superoxide reductase
MNALKLFSTLEENTMQRRSFIRFSLAGLAAGVVAPKLALASGTSPSLPNSPMAGGVYYTKSSPGRWAKKAGAHAPIVVKTANGVKVITGHPMQPNKHWIVKHMLLDKDFRFIAENIFDPTRDKKAISEFKLDKQSGPIYALSVCNLHDTWMTSIKV